MTPLAREMLIGGMLALNSGNTFEPSDANRNDWHEAWAFAEAEGLVVGGSIAPRGRAWLEMIHAVPLPIQSWIDPRGGGVNVGEYTRPHDDYVRKAPTPAPIERPEPPASTFTPSPEQKAAAYAATVPKPPEGFIHHIGLTSKMPDGLKPGDDIEVWYRDGKSDKPARVGKRADMLAAASINWQHRGGDDDVIGWRKLDQPEVTKMVMPKR